MNLAEILKNAKKGLELYSPAFGKVVYEKIHHFKDNDQITVRTPQNELVWFTSDGKITNTGECMLFPSSEKHNWALWQEFIFKPQDIIVSVAQGDNAEHKRQVLQIVEYSIHTFMCKNAVGVSITVPAQTVDFATGEERLAFLRRQLQYEQSKEANKFEPFQKVLVRSSEGGIWTADIYSHFSKRGCPKESVHECVGSVVKDCIPYNEKTAYLLGTTKNFEEE